MIEIKLGENAAFVPAQRIRERVGIDLPIDGELVRQDPSHIVQEVHANLELLDDLHGRMGFMINEIHRIVKR